MVYTWYWYTDILSVILNAVMRLAEAAEFFLRRLKTRPNHLQIICFRMWNRACRCGLLPAQPRAAGAASGIDAQTDAGLTLAPLANRWVRPPPLDHTRRRSQKSIA